MATVSSDFLSQLRVLEETHKNGFRVRRPVQERIYECLKSIERYAKDTQYDDTMSVIFSMDPGIGLGCRVIFDSEDGYSLYFPQDQAEVDYLSVSDKLSFYSNSDNGHLIMELYFKDLWV